MFVRHFLQARTVHIPKHYLGLERDELFSNGLADARCTAGDKHHPVCKKIGRKRC